METKHKITTKNTWHLNIPDEGKVDKLIKDCIIKNILAGNVYVTRLIERHTAAYPCTTQFQLHVVLPMSAHAGYVDEVTYYELCGYYEVNDSVLHLTSISLTSYNGKHLPFKPLKFVDVPGAGDYIIPINITIAPTDDDYVPHKVFSEIEKTKILMNKRTVLEMMHENPDSVRMRLDGCIRTDEVMEAERQAELEKEAVRHMSEERAVPESDDNQHEEHKCACNVEQTPAKTRDELVNELAEGMLAINDKLKEQQDAIVKLLKNMMDLESRVRRNEGFPATAKAVEAEITKQSK